MKFCDLSPPTVPSLDEQRDALRKGLGRAMQWALRGQLADEPLLEACLQDGRFDRETADPRGEWLWKMIQAIGATERFREPILQALHELSDEDNAHQLCQLARHYAENGDETFRKRLYEIVEQKPIKDMPWIGEEELVALDGESAFVFAVRLRGQELPTRDWEWDDDRLIEVAIECFGEDRVTQLISDSSDEAIRRFYQGWLREQKRRADEHPLRHVERLPERLAWVKSYPLPSLTTPVFVLDDFVRGECTLTKLTWSQCFSNSGPRIRPTSWPIY